MRKRTRPQSAKTALKKVKEVGKRVVYIASERIWVRLLPGQSEKELRKKYDERRLTDTLSAKKAFLKMTSTKFNH